MAVTDQVTMPLLSSGGQRRRAIIRVVALAVLFVASLSLNSLVPGLGIWPAAALVCAVSLVSPSFGLALAIFVASFQRWPGITTAHFHALIGASWTAVALGFAVRLRPADLRRMVRSPVVALLAGFTLLVVVHNALPPDIAYFYLDAGFAAVVLLITAALASRDPVAPQPRTPVLAAIGTACIFTIAFDFALVYWPIPYLATANLGQNLIDLPPDMLRLAGVHMNPNATAKFLLAAASFLAAALLDGAILGTGRNKALLWMLVVAALIALVATEAKSAILGCGMAIAALMLLSRGRAPLAKPITLVGLIALIVVTWTAVVAPAVKRHAAASWLSLNIPEYQQRTDLKTLASAPPIIAGLRAGEAEDAPLWKRVADRIIEELRIGRSYQLRAVDITTNNLDAPFKTPVDSTSTKRDCGIGCTGQRDLLWKAGLSTVRRHWLWGIGFGGWKKALEAKLNFPFDSPHNGFVELWGEFGLLGASLYIALAVLLFRRMRAAARVPVEGYTRAFSVGVSLYCVSILATELFEPAKFFAMSPHAIWIWTLLALQERALRPGATRGASPQAEG